MNEADKDDAYRQVRPGEVKLATDPATLPADAGIVFIGHVRTPWTHRSECPRNSLQADKECTVHIDEAYRPGLTSVAECSHVILLYWMHRARRDLIIQTPRHANGSRGCFALRTPVRPNPVSFAVVKLRHRCPEDALDRASAALDRMDILYSRSIMGRQQKAEWRTALARMRDKLQLMAAA